MKKMTTLLAAAVVTLSISACGANTMDCDYYPREHYESWQERCGSGDVSRSGRSVRSFNESLEK